MSNDAETIKVCVRIPKFRKNDLLAFASKLRASVPANKAPGWDSKAIHGISKDKYGGLDGLFRFQGWPEKGNGMMLKFHSHVKEYFDSIKSFVEIHEQPFDGKAFSTVDPNTNEKVIVKIARTALAIGGDDTCKMKGLEKLQSRRFEENGTIFVSSSDL